MATLLTRRAARIISAFDHAIENYLTEVEATKGIGTFRQYRCEFEWFRSHCHKRDVPELNRGDAMRLFVPGRKEIVDGRPLNQKTFNRRVIIMLHAMRSQGTVILMNKGDWPKTIEKKVHMRYVCSDVWKPYLKVLADDAGHALNVLDRLHIALHLNQLVDEVRRVESSWLEPIKMMVRMLRAHEPLLMNWFRARGELSSAAVEGLNNKCRVVTRLNRPIRLSTRQKAS